MANPLLEFVLSLVPWLLVVVAGFVCGVQAQFWRIHQ